MIVTIKTFPKNLDGSYERMIECDTIHKSIELDSVELTLYKDGKLIENAKFEEKTRIFIMENGKTVDRIDFKMNTK